MASWIIRNKQTGEVLMETFSYELVTKLNQDRYTAVPIMKYLREFNAAVQVQNRQVKDALDLGSG